MVSQSFNLKIDLIDLSARLLAAQELIPRARIIARTIADLLPGTAVNAYVLSPETQKPRVFRLQEVG
jgi:hypothetical protein